MKVNGNTGMPDQQCVQMNRNIFKFSGAKGAAMQLQIQDLLMQNGKARNWDSFKAEVLKLNKAYNVNHLQAEYQTAKQAGIHAANWQAYQANKKQFPNLKYKTQQDDRVRDEHRALEGIVAPLDSDFWKKYYPPNGWRCRCYVVQTAETASESIPSEVAGVRPEFVGNVGIGAETFNSVGTGGGKAHQYFVVAREAGVEKKIQRLYHKQLENEAFVNLVKREKQAVNPELPRPIKFTRKSIKELINQPHESYEEKNEIAPYMDSVLAAAEYLGQKPDFKENQMVKAIHVFRTELNGKAAFLIVRELIDGNLQFHSISDNPKVAEGAKK